MTHSIKWKAGLIVAVVFIIALSIAGLFLVHIVETNLETQTIHIAQQDASLAVKQIEEQFAYLQQAYFGLAFDSAVMKWLSQADNAVLSAGIDSKLETLLMASNYNVFSLYLKDLRDGKVYSTEAAGWTQSNEWVADFSSGNFNTPRLITKNTLTDTTSDMISLTGQLRKDYWGEPLAWISVNLLTYQFAKILNADTLYEDAVLLITDEHGQPVCFGKNEIPQDAVSAVLQTQSGETLTVDGREYIVIGMQTNKYDWQYHKLLPTHEVFAGVREMRTVVITILFLFTVVVFFFLYQILNYVTDPIFELSDVVRSYRQKGNGNQWKGSFKTNRKDEFSYLYQSLDQMTARIDVLIDEDYKSQLYKKETQLRVYRNSINPHFLYNILDSIVWTLKFKKYEKAETMLQDFSSFLHHVLHENKEFITVQEEAAGLRAFCNLSSFLKDDTITCQIQFSPEILSDVIPSFLLQPLVENCFKHAFKDRETGDITICGAQKNHSLIFTVADNGVGMSAQRCAQLLTYLDSYDINKEKEHFGLASVHQRMMLYFGASYGLKIDSVQGEGTTISLCIPLEKSRKFLPESK